MAIRDDKSEPVDYDGDDMAAGPFVGRHKERSDAKSSLLQNGGRLVKVYGPPMMGKSRFARKVMRELKMDCSKSFQTFDVTMRDIDSYDLFRLKTAAAIGLLEIDRRQATDVSDDSILHHLRTKRIDSVTKIILFDGCENIMLDKELRNKFLCFLPKLLRLSCSVMMTSRTHFQLPDVTDISSTIEITGLSREEGVQMLQHISPNASWEGTLCDIVEALDRCPKLLLLAGSQLRDSGNLLKPKEFLELLQDPSAAISLLSPQFSSDDNQLAHVLHDFFSQLSDYIKTKCVEYAYLRGSFGSDAAAAIAGYKSALKAKTSSLLEVHDRSIIEFDNAKERFTFPSYMRTYVELTFSHLRSSDVVRKRHVDFFGRLLLEGTRRVSEMPAESVFSYLQNDWENFKHMLNEVIHGTSFENLFELYYKVAVDANHLIIECLPESALSFYKMLLKSAKHCGTATQIAALRSSYGCTLTGVKGNELKKAMRQYEKSRAVLSDDENSYELMKLLGQMAWNTVSQGDVPKAIEFYKKALAMKVIDDDESKVINRQIALRAALISSTIFDGKYDEADQMIDETLEYVTTKWPHHCSLPSILNSKGLNMERSGRFDEHALQFYMASLSKRRPLSKLVTSLLVPSLNNVAMGLSRIGRHEQCINLLTEALEIRKEHGYIHQLTGLTYWNLGMVHLRKGCFQDARVMITESLSIYTKCTPNHFAVVDVSVWLAHCHLVLGDLNAAKELFKKVLEMSEQYRSRLRTGKNILATLEHLLRMPVENGKEWETIKHQVKCELHRLAPIFESENNKEMAQELSDLMQENENRQYESKCSNSIVSPSVCLACKEIREFKIIDQEVLKSLHCAARKVVKRHEFGTEEPHWVKYRDEGPTDRPIKISDEGRYLLSGLFHTKANSRQGHTIFRHVNRVPTEMSDGETDDSVSMDDKKLSTKDNQSHSKLLSQTTLYSEQRKQAVEHTQADAGSSKGCKTLTLCCENRETSPTNQSNVLGEICLSGCLNKNTFTNGQIFSRCDSLKSSNDHPYNKETNDTSNSNMNERDKEEVKNNNAFHESNFSCKEQSSNEIFIYHNGQILKYDTPDRNLNINDTYVSQNDQNLALSNEEVESLLFRSKSLVDKYSSKDNVEI